MAAAPAPTQTMQGIEVPTSSVNPGEFFRLTRRQHNAALTQGSYAGLGNTDTIEIRKAGILSNLMVKVTGTVVVVHGTGSAASSGRWPYDLARFRFSANGQSNLINTRGAVLKVRELIRTDDLVDRGVAQAIGGASPGTSRTQGTLSLAQEAWGVGQNVTAIASGTYAFELTWLVPVAFDDKTLIGAIFAQTSATDLALAIDWAPLSDLFTITGNDTVTVNVSSLVVEPEIYSIPQGPHGDVIVPDLSTFHMLVDTRTTAIGQGDNEFRLAGQGVGKQLMALGGRVINGATPVPVPVNAANYGQIGYRYGANDTPEVWPDGNAHAHHVERTTGVDLCTFGGFFLIDEASLNAFRDSIDMGTATELRGLINITNSVTLTSAALEYFQELLSVGAAA